MYNHILLLITRCRCCEKYSDMEGQTKSETFSHVNEITKEIVYEHDENIEKRNHSQVKFEDCDQDPLLNGTKKSHDPNKESLQADLDNFSHNLENENKLEEVVVSTTN